MMQKHYSRPLICCVILFSFFSCSKPTKPVEPAQVETAEMLYPHSERFKLTNQHGVRFYSGPETCKSCHGQDLLGGNADVSCLSCHLVYPHSPEFKTTAAHGGEFLANRNVCAQCHGRDYQGRNEPATWQGVREALPPSCKKCHNYPHEAKWAFPQNHGGAFVETLRARAAEQTVACLNCHGETASFRQRHQDHFVSCGTCHVALPHTEDFKEGDHGDIARTYDGKCTRCHTNLTRHMPTMGNCLSCHEADGTTPIVRWGRPGQ